MKDIKKIIVLIVLAFYSCSFPKVILIEDTLTAEEHNDLGVVYLEQKKYELAEKEFLKAIKKRSKWDLPYFNLGNAYYFVGDFDKAEEFYKKTLELNAKNTDAMNNLAYLFMEQCRLDEALKLIEKAITIQSKEEYRDTLKKIKNRKCAK